MSFDTIEAIIGGITICLMVVTQIMYMMDVIKLRVKPSVLSWFGWALLMGVGMLAQILESGWEYSQLPIIAATFGCVSIGVTALLLKHYSLQKVDWYILAAGLFCLVLYLVSNNAWLTTIYSIVADFVIAIPTLIKVYNDPKSEKSNAWYISFTSWFLTLIICFNHNLLYALFPTYLFMFSVGVIVLMNRKQKVLKLTV
jgi:hypothetical protein